MIKKQTKEYYDFHEMRDQVDKELGFKQRDAHKHYGGDYKDFWHYQLDNLFSNNVQNDSMNSVYVGMDEEYTGNMTGWQKDIQQVYHDLFYSISDEGWIEVFISW